MLIPCPLCGPRDRREFYYSGSEDYLTRPGVDDAAGWDDHLHLRNNPAGETRDLWYHETGCASWLLVTRDTVTHRISGAVLVADVGASGGDILAKVKPGARE